VTERLASKEMGDLLPEVATQKGVDRITLRRVTPGSG